MSKEKEKKDSPAKQRIIANYEEQKRHYLGEGYTEIQETISIVKANVMAFVTAGPFALLGIIIWIAAQRWRGMEYDKNIIGGTLLFFMLIIASMFIHELLHGAGWQFFTRGKWKSIYLGVMWEYLTPYCHCKEPLKPKQYLVGVLTPFMVLGVGVYVAAFVSGSHLLFVLSLLNILSAGGDTTIACMELKYLKQKEGCYILDHPTECGFIAFKK